jgi:hypothetical protein
MSKKKIIEMSGTAKIKNPLFTMQREIYQTEKEVNQLEFNLHNFRHLRWLVGLYENHNNKLLKENLELKIAITVLFTVYAITIFALFLTYVV